MKTIWIRLTTVLVVAGGMTVVPLSSTAQVPGSVVGVVGGWVTNEQVWRSEYETEAVGGGQFGGFVNAATPLSWFRVRAEFLWTQRGGSVTGQISGDPLVGETRTDYLTVGVQPRAALRIGRLEVFGVAGPMLEVVLRNRFTTELAVAVQEVGTAYGVGRGSASRCPSMRRFLPRWRLDFSRAWVMRIRGTSSPPRTVRSGSSCGSVGPCVGDCLARRAAGRHGAHRYFGSG